jgi:hypothetical protein
MEEVLREVSVVEDDVRADKHAADCPEREVRGRCRFRPPVEVVG